MTDSTLSQIARKPVRIQRKRTKGWRMPPNTVYVGRPTKWGNPFRIEEADEPGPDRRENAVLAFQLYVFRRHAEVRKELRGNNLACFCRLDQPCHADVLLEIANVVPSTSPDEKE